MRKSKKLEISKVDSGDFTFNDELFAMSSKKTKPIDPFKGFDIPDPDFSEDMEKDMASMLAYTHDALLWIDKHPPKTNFILDTIHFLIVCFEYRKQRDTFLKDIGVFKYANRHVPYTVFVNLFKIDVVSGKRVDISSWAKAKKEQKPQIAIDLNLDLDLGGFGKPKKQIGEKLKNIRADEKKTAEFLSFGGDTSFWFSVLFETDKQKVNFIKSLDLKPDKVDNFDVVWGADFAKKFYVDLVPCPFSFDIRPDKLDPKFSPFYYEI